MPRRTAGDRALSALSEPAEPVRRLVPLDADARDVAGTAARGDILAEQLDQRADGGLWTLRVDLHPAVRQVPGVPHETELKGTRPCPPAETDPLDPTPHEDDRSHHGLSLGSGHREGHLHGPFTWVRRRGGSSAGARDPWPRLAPRAVVRRPVHERLAPDRGAAPVARLTLATVGVQRPVEVAAGTVDVDIQRVKARPALAERLTHHLGRVVEDPRQGRLGQRPGLPQRVDVRPPEGLVGIYVADATDHPLV